LVVISPSRSGEGSLWLPSRHLTAGQIIDPDPSPPCCLIIQSNLLFWRRDDFHSPGAGMVRTRIARLATIPH